MIVNGIDIGNTSPGSSFTSAEEESLARLLWMLETAKTWRPASPGLDDKLGGALGNIGIGSLLGFGQAGGALGAEAAGSTITGQEGDYGTALGADVAGLGVGLGLGAWGPWAGGAGVTPAAAGGAEVFPVAAGAAPEVTALGIPGGGWIAPEAVAAGGVALPATMTAGGAAATGGGLGLGAGAALGLGAALPAALGAYGANQQAGAYERLARDYMAMGDPYRQRLAQLYADPTAFLNSPEVKIPVQQGTDALARALSIQGNPAGSGTALQELQNYASNQIFGRLGQEKDRLAGFGGLSAYNQAAPSAAGAGIAANKGIYDAIGAGFADVFNPPTSLADLLKGMRLA